MWGHPRRVWSHDLRPLLRCYVALTLRQGISMMCGDLGRLQGPALGLAVLASLVIAALVPPARSVVVIVLALGAVGAPRGSALAWATSAGLPVAIVLVWGAVVGDALESNESDCGNILSPLVLHRVMEALMVGITIALLARRLGVTVRSLGLPRPTSRELLLGSLAIVVIPVASLRLGEALAAPFFGPIHLDLSQPGAIVPAMMLAVANGTMEELAYRGALMSWLSRASGPRLALVGQAVVFGAAHTGSDYVASAIPVVLVIVAGGLVAGFIVRRTGSLLLPIVVHICFDVPLYYALACRLNPG
jgi:membrane protease YdiL (CAAX protease family)